MESRLVPRPVQALRHALACSLLLAATAVAGDTPLEPVDLALLGTHLIQHGDDESFIRFHVQASGTTREDIARIQLPRFRTSMAQLRAQAARDGDKGNAFLAAREALTRVQCAPKGPASATATTAEGEETRIVRIRCLYPTLHHIDADAPAPQGEGPVIAGSNRSWATYRRELSGPADTPLEFTWVFHRNPAQGRPLWQPQPFNYEQNNLLMGVALSATSVPGGTLDMIRQAADEAEADARNVP
ncbi:hypothetical protein [Stenotrophomonas sp. 24(2023)]|uniref:hypothetical protein n=1 Tax=Stenotrophomonas sp. 24(2023) TaxID=3068324 RepID=UPI0027E1E666|nr:hypothetical protein [Stenotrophomonas sp. 24(2023)]WMJ69774.1 hypothetical protein Q9R17_01285 [Stenotrophomonas sp. 24(2023)]